MGRRSPRGHRLARPRRLFTERCWQEERTQLNRVLLLLRKHKAGFLLLRLIERQAEHLSAIASFEQHAMALTQIQGPFFSHPHLARADQQPTLAGTPTLYVRGGMRRGWLLWAHAGPPLSLPRRKRARAQRGSENVAMLLIEGYDRPVSLSSCTHLTETDIIYLL